MAVLESAQDAARQIARPCPEVQYPDGRLRSQAGFQDFRHQVEGIVILRQPDRLALAVSLRNFCVKARLDLSVGHLATQHTRIRAGITRQRSGGGHLVLPISVAARDS